MLRLATVAQLPHQSLGDHGAQRRFEEEALDAEVEQPRHCGGRGFGVQGGQHQVARQGRMNRDMCGLRVAHLADHDDVRVLAHEGTHGGCER